MRKLVFALALGLAIEGAAQACSCAAPQSDQQKREWARNMVKVAIAVVEVEPIDDMHGRYRVTRVYSGKAPATFRVDRSGPASTCDDFPSAGQRKVVVLYDPRPYAAGISGASIRARAEKSPPSTYIFGGICQRLFIDEAGGLQLIREEARKLGLTAR